jgi:hypothetical protein
MVFSLDSYARLLDPLYFDAAALAEYGGNSDPCLPGAGVSLRLVSGKAARECARYCYFY